MTRATIALISHLIVLAVLIAGTIVYAYKAGNDDE